MDEAGADDPDALQRALTAWIEAQHQRPTQDAIRAHPLYLAHTAVMRARAPPPLPGACLEFVRRRARFCTNRATPGDPDSLCGMHRAMRIPARAVPTDCHPDSNNPEETNNAHISTTIASTAVAHAHPGRKTNLRKRMKRMLNPFTVGQIDPRNLPVWENIYADTTLPLMVDIGCAKGRYLQSLSAQLPSWNFCGVEIFAPLVTAANALLNTPSNLFYVNSNITLDLEVLKFPNLQRVSLLFPDPWSCGDAENGINRDENEPTKKSRKNMKKRVMTPEFAMRLAKLLKKGSEVYFASDWLDLAVDIRTGLLSTGCFDIPVAEEGTAAATNMCGKQVETHVAQRPYVPTKTTSELCSAQWERQKKVQRSLIDVETAYAKPEVQNGIKDGEAMLWLGGIPFGGTQTERDLVCEAQWRAVYRLVVERNGRASE
ncbi:hypothetical protein HDU84_001244 [Entophlyctis sp. JEL0112]|nr:hypothetical protein HDU84_001244 [Entophlyctis sp. JEL0112]